jgi:hypothetical protein
MERLVEGRYEKAKRERNWAGQPREHPDGFLMPLPLGGRWSLYKVVN